MAINKIFLILILFGFTVITFAQQGIYWSPPIEVAASSFGNKSPRIALLSDGSPAVVWGKGSIMYFSLLEGEDFTSPVEINTNGISPDIYSFGGIDLATFADNVFIVYEDFATGIHLVRSTNGGQTFELPVSAYDPPAGLWATLPSVSTDDLGNPLVSVLRELNNETQARYVMMRSGDGGQTFGPPVVANEPASGEYVCECCPSDIFAKGDNVFLIFRNNDNNLRDMWVSRSTDGGLNFTEATDVDDTDWVINACPISGPIIAPLSGDSLITAWKSGASGNSRISFSTLHTGTMEKGWEFEFPQTNNNSGQETPDMAGANDTIGIVWQESGFGANSSDLLFAFSKTGTSGLTDNFTNITEAPGIQRNPALAYGNGSFHLVYADASGGILYQKGVVSEVNHVNPVFTNELFFKIISQPVIGNEIMLQNGEQFIHDAELTLSNMTGQIIHQMSHNHIFPNQKISFVTGVLPKGVYVLQARSGSSFWAEKLIFDK